MMLQEILTKVVTINKNTINIETELHKMFNCEIIRWAIVKVEQGNLKICCSYKK